MPELVGVVEVVAAERLRGPFGGLLQGPLVLVPGRLLGDPLAGVVPQQPRHQLVRRQRLAEQVSLGDVAVQVAQRVQGLGVLDALGHHPHPEVVRQFDHRPDDCGVGVASQHLHHERLVDLQLADRQVRQLRQAGVTLPEVVQAELDVGRLEPGQHLRRDRGVGDQGGLGDLQDHPVVRAAGPGQGVQHQFGEVRALQAAGRDVDRDHQVRGDVLPGRELGDRGIQDPPGHRLDQAGQLGRRDEGVRVEQAPGRVLPADQRLDRDHLAVGLADLRLVVQDQFVPLQGPAQLGDQGQLLGVVVVLLGVVVADPGVRALGHLQGDVGVLQGQVGRLAVARHEDHAHARLDRDGQAGQVDLLLDRGLDPGQHRGGLELGAHPLQDEAELVAAEPGHGVLVADGLHQPLGQAGEQGVAVVVAEGVVDAAELVHVQQHDGTAAVLLGGDDRGADPLREAGPVGQVGQRVVQGQMLEQLGLPAQPPGGHPGQAGQHQVQQAEARGQGPVEPVQPAGHLLLDRAVRQVGLEHADHGAVGAGEDRGVDLHDVLARALGAAGGAVQRRQLDHGPAGGGLARPGRGDALVRGLRLDRAVVGVDDDAVGGPQPEPGDPLGPDLGGGEAPELDLLHVVHRGGQRMALEHGRAEQPGHHLALGLPLDPAALLHLHAKLHGKHAPEHEDGQQAQNSEGDEESCPTAELAGRRCHVQKIGTCLQSL